MTPRMQTLSLLVLGLVAVATVRSQAENKSDNKGEKPRAAVVMEPFQTAVTITLPVNSPTGIGEGEASFTVPAGRRLNLRYVGAKFTYVPASGAATRFEYPPIAEIETSVGGAFVTHYVSNGLVTLWGDDSAPITIRVSAGTGGAASATVQYSISGDLY
jgi:hypothetical protein